MLPDLKNSQGRRNNCKYDKAGCEKKDGKPGKEEFFFRPGIPALAAFCFQIYDRESKNHADIENQNVYGGIICPQNSGMSVKQRRNGKSARQDTHRIGVKDTGKVLFQVRDSENSVQQHGEKQQFHVLPGGFIDWCKKPCQDILSRPVVNKMCKSA